MINLNKNRTKKKKKKMKSICHKTRLIIIKNKKIPQNTKKKKPNITKKQKLYKDKTIQN